MLDGGNGYVMLQAVGAVQMNSLKVANAGAGKVAFVSKRNGRYCSDTAHGITCDAKHLTATEKFEVAIVQKARPTKCTAAKCDRAWYSLLLPSVLSVPLAF